MLILLVQVWISIGQEKTLQLESLSNFQKTVKIFLPQSDLAMVHVVQQVCQVLRVHIVQNEMQVRARALLEEASEVVTTGGEDDSVSVELHKVA